VSPGIRAALRQVCRRARRRRRVRISSASTAVTEPAMNHTPMTRSAHSDASAENVLSQNGTQYRQYEITSGTAKVTTHASARNWAAFERVRGVAHQTSAALSAPVIAAPVASDGVSTSCARVLPDIEH